MYAYIYIYVYGHPPPTTRTPLKDTVNTDTNAVSFSESNFGAVSTDWKHKCKTQKKTKIQKPKNPKIPKIPKSKIQKTKNPRIQNFLHLRNLACVFGLLDFRSLDFWILGFLDFWIFRLNVGFLGACILDPKTCGYLHTRNCISVYRRCQG